MAPLFKVLALAGAAIIGFMIAKDEDDEKAEKPTKTPKPDEKPAPKPADEKDGK